MRTIITFFKHYWQTILVFCLIFYVSLLHTPSIKLAFFPYQDKLVHLLMYLTLSSVICRNLIKANTQLSTFFFTLIVFVLPVSYGGVIELLQGAYFAPHTADWFDFFANATGSALAFIITPLIFTSKN